MRSFLRATLVVTSLTLGSQLVAMLAQTILARYLGASDETDALFAAMTLPQYTTAVLLGGLSVVFIPAFMARRVESGEETAWLLVNNVVNACVLVFAGVAAVGMLFAEPLLRLTVPGLSPSALDLATRLSWVLWPSVLASGMVALLTNLHQIGGRFAWSSTVPLLGATANVVLLAFLLPDHGAIGAAAAITLSLLLQAVLLANAFAKGRYSFVLRLRDPALIHVGRLMLPLVISGLAVRSTVIIDRYLASDLPSGSIAHLGYAFRIVTAIGATISAGLGAVLFPPLADAIANRDTARFRATTSASLRSIWLVVAPIMTIAIVVAEPGVRLLFERGAFQNSDSQAVARLLQVYLIALVAIGLSTVTSRAIYALQATRLMAIFGAVEAVAYVGYTFALAQFWGVLGIAAGFVIYYLLSLTWQGVYLRAATGGKGGSRVMRSLSGSTAMASLSGCAAWLAIQPMSSPVLQLAVGGVTGVFVYLIAIALVRPPEAMDAWRALRAPRATA